jgi:hypothetical protein
MNEPTPNPLASTLPAADEACTFVPAEDLARSCDKQPAKNVLDDAIRDLCRDHGINQAALLRRSLMLLRSISIHMPVNATDGLDAMRADLKKSLVIPSWREQIRYLLRSQR